MSNDNERIDNVIVGKILESNRFGNFEVIEQIYPDDPRYKDNYVNKRSQFLIRFLDTGYEAVVTKGDIMKGTIKDYFRPNVNGIGYLGDLPENLNIQSQNLKFYKIWEHMLSRCYNINDKAYKNYGGIGVTVDPAWHCFKTFLMDLPYIPGYNEMMMNPDLYEFDKDLLQEGVPKEQRVYSKYTCAFILKETNLQIKNREGKNGYYGVSTSRNNFSGFVYINGRQVNVGSYQTAEAAANMHDYIGRINGCKDILYNFETPTMSLTECLSLKKRKRGVQMQQMCEYVDKEDSEEAQ